MSQPAPEQLAPRGNEYSRCTCSGNFPLAIKHTGKGLAILLIRTLLLSLIFAYGMSFLIDGIQNIGIAPVPWPFSAIGQYQARVQTEQQTTNALVNTFDNFLFFYNCAFPGASRLGCGIGMISAAFWTMHDTPAGCQLRRTIIGLVAGAIIGFRLTLMISSKASTVFGSTIIFLLGFSIYMTLADRKSTIKDLPLISDEQ